MAKKKSSTTVINNEIILPGRLGEFIKSLEDEKEKIKKEGTNSILLSNGKRINNSSCDYIYV